MKRFGGGATLDELARSSADLLRISHAALEESDRGAEPINAFITADLDRAASGPPARGVLAGVPIAVKDNIVTVDFPTTCASRLLEGYRSPFDATVVRQLRAAGARIVGKTNLDEFAMGSSTEYSTYGPTRNPVDRTRVPGGSSGGSAAAVAAGVVPIAIGSDSGGSVRQPAAFCGVVGLTPTYGRISRYGLVAFASSLDQVGIFGRTVEDVARVLELLGSHDPMDSTSGNVPPARVMRSLDAGADGAVIGIPAEFFPPSLDPAVARVCRAAIHRLEALGAEVREISLPSTPLAVAAYHVIAAAEASSNLARFDGALFGVRVPGASLEQTYGRTRALLGREVKRRILFGALVLSGGRGDSHLGRARRARRLISEELRSAHRSGVDMIFTPTTPTTAFRIGERLEGQPYGLHASDCFTASANLSGLPAISIPVGSAEGLPVGGQLIGRAWEEAKLLSVAAALEEALPAWTRQA
jgi:aspartyl-tRNA(Asn)/glutamyl-tRNA(Gln) amidotransferase subunit A